MCLFVESDGGDAIPAYLIDFRFNAVKCLAKGFGTSLNSGFHSSSFIDVLDWVGDLGCAGMTGGGGDKDIGEGLRWEP